MFVELAVGAGVTYAYNRFRYSQEYKIKKIFNDICSNAGLSYQIIELRNNNYGYDLIVSLSYEGFEKLDKLKDLLQSTYGHDIEIEQNVNFKTATINILTSRLSDSTKFVPVKLDSPSQIYVGLSYKFKNLISDMNQFPHCLTSGQTGSGKTEELRLILTNSINNFSDRDLNIYFSDLSDMNDFDCFKFCKQVKGYAKTIRQSQKLFEYMMHIYTKRLEIFGKHECKNIKEYNYKNNEKRMNYIFVVADEFADYYPDNKLDHEYEEKVKCYNIIKHLVRKARKAGIFLLIGIQRPDTTVLDASLRSGLCTKVCFSQNNDASSKTVCDSGDLTNIENRKALFIYGNVREWFKSLFITDKIIHQYVKESNTYNREDFNKFLANDTKAIIDKPSVDIQSKTNNADNKKSKSKVKVKIQNDVNKQR